MGLRKQSEEEDKGLGYRVHLLDVTNAVHGYTCFQLVSTLFSIFIIELKWASVLLNDFFTPAESRRGLPADGNHAAAVLLSCCY